jgi:hypothetical protein
MVHQEGDTRASTIPTDGSKKNPMVVNRDQRISLQAEDVSEKFERVCLLYDETEALDAINKKARGLKAELQADLANEIYIMRAGHAGAIDSFVYCLVMNCPVRLQSPSK